ncbi:hypothetical protein F4803DRAFT_568934 [Xylaria telfairii]|nr:hypothetical protein F4803DRAFT_568934 [Xylaria telfairii]
MPGFTEDANENLIACIILIILASLSVLVRFSIQIFYRRKPPQSHDWTCLIALAIFNVYCGLIINFILHISRFHALNIDPHFDAQEIMNLLKFSYINELIFGFGITCIKLSILQLYYSLFAIKKTLQRVIKVTAAICLLWLFVVTFLVAFQCTPVPAYWETLNSSQYCLNPTRLLLAYELSNLFIDVAIVCIPTSAIFKLKLPPLKKIGVMFIFLLGTIICISSMLRMNAIWSQQSTMNVGPRFLWSVLQLGLAIVTGCLPNFGPLWTLLQRPPKCVSNWTGSFVPFLSRKGYNTPDRSPWVRVRGDRLNATSEVWASSDNNGNFQAYSLGRVPPRQILVAQEIEIV